MRLDQGHEWVINNGLLSNVKNWYLVDGHPPPIRNARSVLVSSPYAEVIKEFRKHNETVSTR
jgi:hypothetical protein